MKIKMGTSYFTLQLNFSSLIISNNCLRLIGGRLKCLLAPIQEQRTEEKSNYQRGRKGVKTKLRTREEAVKTVELANNSTEINRASKIMTTRQ